MANITCPITINSQSIVLSQSPDNRTVEVSVGSTQQVLSAILDVGRKGDKGDKGDPGGVNAISAGGVSTSGGTLVFGNSNGVSFGLSDGTLTASHNGLLTAAQSDHSHGAPTLILQDISGVASSASDGLTIGLTGPQLTYSQFQFANSNGITFGTSGSTVTASVNAGLTTAAQSDHTHGGVPTLALTNVFGTASTASDGLTLSLSVNPFTGTATGGMADGYNIIGVNGSTVHSAATIQFSNSNNVSFGLAGSTVTASASYPEQTAFVFSNSNGVSFGTSGSTVTAQAPAQTAFQFANSNGLTFGTNGSTITASHDGAASDHSHGNPVLALTNLSGSTASGSNGLTISLAGQDLPVDGGIALRAGTQTAQSGTVVFSNSNGITFGMSGSSRVTASHDGLTTAALSNHSHGFSVGVTGASVSTSADSGGQTMLLSISHPAADTLYYSAANGSASFDTLKFANSNGVSFSTGTAGLIASVKTDYAETSAVLLLSQSSLLQHTSGTSAITAAAMHTSERGRYFYTSNNTFANSTHTHGNVSVSGLSATSNSGGLTLSVVQSVQTQSRVSINGSSGSISFANSNGITFGGNNSTITASHNGLTTAAQSNHSHGAPSLQLTNLSGTASSNSAGATFSLSALPVSPTLSLLNMWGTTGTDSNGLTLTLSVINPMRTSERSNYFYTSANTFANSTHSHGNPTLALTNITGTTASGSNGLTLSLSAGVGGGGGVAISAGTQSVSTGTLVFSNSHNVTFGMSGSSRITASVDAAVATHSHGNPTLALTNISGTTASGSNGFTLSLSANSGLTTAALSNHSHGNPTLALTNLTGTTASGSNGLTLSLSAGVGGSGGGIALQNSQTTYGTGTVNLSAAGGALTIVSGTGQRMMFSVPQTSSLVGVNLTLSTSGSTISVSAPPAFTASGYCPFGFGGESVAGQHGAGTLYMVPIGVVPNLQFDRVVMPVNISNASNSSNSWTLSASVGLFSRNGDSLSLIASGSQSWNGTASGTVGSYSLWGGIKHATIPLTTTLSQGHYWAGIWSRTTTGGGAGQTLNQMLVSQPNSSFSGILGEATNATDQNRLGQGRYSVSFSTAMPSAIAISHIQGNSSILQRPPSIFFASSTV